MCYQVQSLGMCRPIMNQCISISGGKRKGSQKEGGGAVSTDPFPLWLHHLDTNLYSESKMANLIICLRLLKTRDQFHYRSSNVVVALPPPPDPPTHPQSATPRNPLSQFHHFIFIHANNNYRSFRRLSGTAASQFPTQSAPFFMPSHRGQ